MADRSSNKSVLSNDIHTSNADDGMNNPVISNYDWKYTGDIYGMYGSDQIETKTKTSWMRRRKKRRWYRSLVSKIEMEAQQDVGRLRRMALISLLSFVNISGGRQ